MDSSSQSLLFETLPCELLRSILSRFSDAESLSAFLQAVSSSVSYRNQGVNVANEALQERLNCLKKKEVASDEFLLSFFNDTAAQTDTRDMNGLLDWIRRISCGLVVISFFEEYKVDNGVHCKSSPPEYPVWCGMLYMKIYPPDGPGRISEAARVVISTPKWKRSFMRDWRINMSLCGFFSPEPRRFVPVAPFGRVVGLMSTDQACLARISHRLHHYDEVGVSRAIRFISGRQALTRIADYSFLPDYQALSSLFGDDDQNNDSLFAFWYNTEETLPPQHDDTIYDMMQLMTTKQSHESTLEYDYTLEWP